MNRLGNIIKAPIDIKPSPDELLEIQINEYNNLEGNLKEFNCPLCKNKGWIAKRGQSTFDGKPCEVRVECECTERRHLYRRAQKNGLGMYLNKTIDSYIVTDEWQAGIKKKAVQYMNDESGAWFLILGQSGAGKTLICSIIANDLLMNKKRTVLYITWTDFIGKLKRDMVSDNADKVSVYLDRLKNVDVLFIDELLKKYNDTDLRYIMEIINYRYAAGLKTIISSERSLNELLDIDEATTGRMIELAGDYVTNIGKDRNKNYRLRGLL